jgi:hypothetical protein
VQEEAPNEDDPHDIQIEEAKEERELEGTPLESEVIFTSIKVNKVNIGIVENPKMGSIGDYWCWPLVMKVSEDQGRKGKM